MSLDTIVHNAKIATNSKPPFVEALAIMTDKIVAIGRNEKIHLDCAVQRREIIDGNART